MAQKESECKLQIKKAPGLGAFSTTGGERGIRTPDRLLTYTRFPGVRLQPLIHLSGILASFSEAADYSNISSELRGFLRFL
jgi:hypothetical protein